MITSRTQKKIINNKTRNVLFGLCFIIIVLMAYAPALKNGYIWDDEQHVTENSLLRSLEGLKKIWFDPSASRQYYPLTFSSFWAEYHIWNLNPFGYHLVNVLLHILNAVLLFFVLRRLNIRGAWMAATIFALHPVHVESVAWISERKNVLSGFFYLSSLLFYIRFALTDNNLRETPADSPPKNAFHCLNKNYLLSMGLFICALLSKTVTCSLPAVLLLILWWKKDKLSWQAIRALVPMFIVGFAFGLNTVFMEKSNVGAQGAEWSFTLIDRILIAGRALWFYVGKIIWPDPLIFIYPRWEINSAVWWQYLYPLAAFSIIAVLFLMRNRIGKGPLTAVLIFFGTLLPALGFFNLYPHRFSFVADHFQYLASIPIIVLIFACLADFINKYFKKGQTIVLIFFLPLFFIAVFLTWKQTHVYQNPIIIYEDTIKKNPQCWMANYNIAIHLQNQGKLQKAVKHYLETIRIKPDCLEAYYNIGNVFKSQGRMQDAIRYYSETIRIDPGFAKAYNNLGTIYQKQGHIQKAAGSYLEAIRLNPELFEAHNNMGIIYMLTGDTDSAIACFQKAIRIEPDYTAAKMNLKKVLTAYP